MKITHKNLNVLYAGLVLSLFSLNANALDSHMAIALDHAQTASKINDVKVIGEQAEMAKSHIKVVEDHLKESNTSLDAAIAHSKQGHADLARKSAEEAVVHLKAAQ
jgi:hypothetical protein